MKLNAVIIIVVLFFLPAMLFAQNASERVVFAGTAWDVDGGADHGGEFFMLAQRLEIGGGFGFFLGKGPFKPGIGVYMGFNPLSLLSSGILFYVEPRLLFNFDIGDVSLRPYAGLGLNFNTINSVTSIYLGYSGGLVLSLKKIYFDVAYLDDTRIIAEFDNPDSLFNNSRFRMLIGFKL